MVLRRTYGSFLKGVLRPLSFQCITNICLQMCSRLLFSENIAATRAKLVYCIYFIMMLFAGLTAIEIKHLIVLGSFNTEIFQLMNSMASVMVGCFSGAKA